MWGLWANSNVIPIKKTQHPGCILLWDFIVEWMRCMLICDNSLSLSLSRWEVLWMFYPSLPISTKRGSYHVQAYLSSIQLDPYRFVVVSSQYPRANQFEVFELIMVSNELTKVTYGLHTIWGLSYWIDGWMDEKLHLNMILPSLQPQMFMESGKQNKTKQGILALPWESYVLKWHIMKVINFVSY